MIRVMIPIIIQIAVVYFIIRTVVKKANSYNAQPARKRTTSARQSRQIKQSKPQLASNKAKATHQNKPLATIKKRPAEIYSSQKTVNKNAYKDACWIKEEDTWIKDN